MAINSAKKLSPFINRIVPDFVVNDHPGFVDFFRSYFEFLEQKNNPFEIIDSLLHDMDIDNSVNDFFESYRSTFAQDLPNQNRADLALVIKNIREYYSQKGNENSFAFLFRTIYDEPIEFYYPTVDILKTSDGKWYKPTYIVFEDMDGNAPTYLWLKDNFLSKSIIGLTSGDIGYVEGFIEVNSPKELLSNPNPAKVWACKITGAIGSFVEGEVIRLRDDSTNMTTARIMTGIFDGWPAIEVQEGRWINTDGFLSSNKYLQDNYFYQEHSYQIRVAMSSDYYWRTIRKNVHPAGTIFFGVVDFLDGILARMDDFSDTYLSTTSYSTIEMGLSDAISSPYWTSNQAYTIEMASDSLKGLPTYAIVQANREQFPYNQIYSVGAFDLLQIGSFQNGTAQLPIGTDSLVTIV